MPSCSNSSNISSAINTVNVTQGSGGSRFLIQIPQNLGVGLTLGNVIRWDVTSQGYTASRANLPENAEVFGIVESYDSTTSRFNVVLSGSITLDSNNFAYIPSSPSGAAGGNDIFFLSGQTAGLLQNLAPTDPSHITKPIYQVAPHGIYTGAVTNYSGYRLGGDVQASLDTVNILARVGSVHWVLGTYPNIEYDGEANRMYMFGYGAPGGVNDPVRPIFLLDPKVPYDWNLEYINITFNDPSEQQHILRKVDFPEASEYTLPTFNDGWIERVKLDTGFTETRSTLLGKKVRQIDHRGYSLTAEVPVEYGSQYVGKIIDYDPNTRHIYIQRPAYIITDFAQLGYNYLYTQIAETTADSRSKGELQICNDGQDNWSVNRTVTIRSSDPDPDIIFVGFVNPLIALDGSVTNPQNPNSPFYIASAVGEFFGSYNPYDYEIIPKKLYMKIKNRGLGVVIPSQLNVNNVNITSSTPPIDVSSKLQEFENRISALEQP